MKRPLRPTLRCLREDLHTDWEDVSHYRAILQGRRPTVSLDDVAHPLVRASAQKFASPASPEALAARENISGTREPTWWKAKSGRWRGAIYIDPATDQAWLCAAGLRYEGESSKDFYKVFTADVVAHGPEPYLPSQQDLDELEIEGARDRLAEWEVSAAAAILQAVGSVASSETRVVDLPTLDNFHMPRVEIELVEIDGPEWVGDLPETIPAEVSLRLIITDWSDPLVLRRVQVVACSAVAPNLEAWDSAPGVDQGRTMLASIDESRLAQIRAAVRLDDTVDSQMASSDLTILPSSSAHWTHKNLLARAIVEGRAVPALCGAWFVPTQDPLALPICAKCVDQYDSLVSS